MRLPGRLAAAMAVLADVDSRRRPVSEALKDWGNANRFAGAGDRAAIGNLVYDALRRRASHSWRMGADTPRALILAVAVCDWRETVEAMNAAGAGDRFAPEPITEAERARLTAPDGLAGAPDHVRADVPEWIAPRLEAAFGDAWVAEGVALTLRPPLDMRANTLRADRDRVLRALKRFDPEPTAISAIGVRIPSGQRDSRTPNVQVDEGYLKGWFEIQDQGSQIVSELIGAEKGEQVLDLCAGAGGKTLAMAAAMRNTGQIFAFDSERARLAPIYDRLKRSGVRNVQVRAPEPGALDDLFGRLHRVVVDAPCTGSGTWRRRPDAKWKLTSEQLAERTGEQRAILDDAARYVRPGGTLAYITCSVLPDENDAQIEAFLTRHAGFGVAPPREVWAGQFGASADRAAFTRFGLMLSPRLSGTDGFYFCRLLRTG